MRLPVFVVVAVLVALSCPEPSDRWSCFVEQDYEFGPHIEPSGESYALQAEPEEGDSGFDKESLRADFSS